MNPPAFAAVDWGTSSFRLWLVDRDGGVVAERRSQEGMIAAAKAGFAAVLGSHLDAAGAAKTLPVLICGMAGARQGWIEAGYIDTPAPLAGIGLHAVSVPGQPRDIRILPGIAQRDRTAPDVMRGEETQLLGALGMDVNDVLVCLPGTHSKWVTVQAGRVDRFSTFMTGELYEAVTTATILSHAVEGADSLDEEAFRSAVAAACKTPAAAANLLFQARSRQLLFGATASASRGSISGTLIGLELAAGLAAKTPSASVTLVASGRLRGLYELAFDTLGTAVRAIDAEAAVRRGLSIAARAIWK